MQWYEMIYLVLAFFSNVNKSTLGQITGECLRYKTKIIEAIVLVLRAKGGFKGHEEFRDPVNRGAMYHATE